MKKILKGFTLMALVLGVFVLAKPVLAVLSDPTPEQPTGMKILNHDNKNLGCEGYTNNRSITIDWDDNSENNFDHYEYQIREERTIAYPAISQLSGDIRDEDGYYKYRVRAVDSGDNFSDWTDWCGVTLDREAPVITFVKPEAGSTHSEEIDLKAICNEDCSYVNFWWRAEGESFSSTSKRYHYVREIGTDFEWELDTLAAQLWNSDTYVMGDGTYYLYAAGKDLAGNWARTSLVEIFVDNSEVEDDGEEEDDDGDGEEEIAEVPEYKDECKEGGWESWLESLGFRNQGDCVSFVQRDYRSFENKHKFDDEDSEEGESAEDDDDEKEDKSEGRRRGRN